MKRLAFLAACAALCSTAAIAQEINADYDKNGKVTTDEYTRSRREFLMSTDRNKDGKIGADEWARAVKDQRNQMIANGIPNADVVGKGGWFESIDTNHDGFVTPAEIEVFTHARFTQLDLNSDGSISRAEENKLRAAAQSALRK